MNPTTKQLRPYQVRLVTDVCRETEDVLVEQPTGSGKTVQIVTPGAVHLGQRFTHAIISAPQEQIEQGFVRRDYQAIAFPDCQGVAQPVHAAPEQFIRGARRSGLGSVRQIAAYLRQPGPLDTAVPSRGVLPGFASFTRSSYSLIPRSRASRARPAFPRWKRAVVLRWSTHPGTLPVPALPRQNLQRTFRLSPLSSLLGLL
jgi:hypothetical protein